MQWKREKYTKTFLLTTDLDYSYDLFSNDVKELLKIKT